ncbi:MAG: 3-hydroxyacyl-CoA dehydrogenase [Herbiconiux sp.]|uniref:Rv3235 family protein n=1 Tax=Herbiconiux sp. TaxID=1871186 RepID=UPI0012267990|nr:Rv3235 family protein [Herbiconiux sp.]TAJ49346.1 MAG: 3-hydroxyacyl-CoA dehydrogenase [Herbiconiux sp.]
MITSLAVPAPSALSPTAIEREPPDDPVPSTGPGEARALAMNLARCVVEILAGTREIDQIARWLSSDVYTHLLKRVVISARARAARGESPGRLTFTMGSTVMCEPTPGVVEAVVIVHGRARSRAVAIRLERLESRWRASAVHVL